MILPLRTLLAITLTLVFLGSAPAVAVDGTGRRVYGPFFKTAASLIPIRSGKASFLSRWSGRWSLFDEFLFVEQAPGRLF
jgi:hypothetical protein